MGNNCTSPSIRISRYELLFLVPIVYEMNVNLFSPALQLGTAASATSIVAKTATVSSIYKMAADGILSNGGQVCTCEA